MPFVTEEQLRKSVAETMQLSYNLRKAFEKGVDKNTLEMMLTELEIKQSIRDRQGMLYEYQNKSLKDRILKR